MEDVGDGTGRRWDGCGCVYGGRRRRLRSVDARERDRGGERGRGVLEGVGLGEELGRCGSR